MRIIDFSSPFAGEMEHFIKLKQLSGSDYYSQARLLLRFDLYLVSNAFEGNALTKTIFQNYFNKLGHLHKKTFLNHYSILYQFSLWLNQRRSDSYVLEKRQFARHSVSRQAYIFTPIEINTILKNAQNLTKKEEIRPGLYQTLFSLLYSTGIRIGEALALNHGDYSKAERLIHIKKGKFRKERYIILSKSLAHGMNQYLDGYGVNLPYEESSPLFINMRSKRLTHTSAFKVFVKILNMSQIYKDKNTGPRLHDFRHTFAVHRLLQWYKTEEDINAKLPVLSTYLGHVNITSTQVYLEAASELLKPGSERFHQFYLKHIK